MPVSPSVFSVLRLLSDGEFHSGQTLAEQLQMSRSSVWNAVKAAQQMGLSVHRVRGRGYRLATPLKWLERGAIESALGDKRARFKLEIADCVDSSNTRLFERCMRGAEGGTLLIAEWQSAGRGRRGRLWLSPFAGAVTFSLLWRFDRGPEALLGLSLAVGVALARALEQSGVREARLKWPNDVLWNGRKLAGILIEVAGEALGPSAAVIGVGVNVRLPDTFKAEIDQPATDLVAACGSEIDRNQVTAAILRELADVLSTFSEHGFAPFCAEWNRRHAHARQPVTLLLPGGASLEGIAENAAEDGALVLRTGLAAQRFYAGEISLRGA